MPKVKHGMHKSKTYTVWCAMKNRCTNPNYNGYSTYGGRGIKVCERWMKSFEAFYEDMGERPEGMSLDRYPNSDGDYEPGNCRWATTREQTRNRSDTRMLTHDGRTQCMKDWAAEVGLPYHTFSHRLARGWPLELALKK